MLSHLSPRERLGYAALAAILLFFAGYVGARHLKQPAPITIQGLTGSEAASGQAIVHVSGAVKNPGTVTLDANGRVQDAIAMAGGASSDANLDAINLAAKVIDGAQINVPGKGQEVSSASESVQSALPVASSPGGAISLSTASAKELESVPGIGPATSARILEYRAANGGFRTVDELIAVKGIGPKRLEQLRPYVRP